MYKIKESITKDKLILTIAIIWLATIILPVLLACTYALPSSDDFSMAIDWPDGDGILLVQILRRVKSIYLTWGGPYFTVFIAAFPVFRIMGVAGVRAMLAVGAVAFFAAFILLVREACHWLGIDEKVETIASIVLSALMLLLLINGNYEDEIFYWYESACAYTAPLMVSMFCVACFLAYERKESLKTLVEAVPIV